MPTDNFKISQDFEIIPTQRQKVYTISIEEWAFIKKKIGGIKEGINIYFTIGTVLLGASVTSLIAALSNDFQAEKSHWICWAAFIITLICGLVCGFLGFEKIKMKTASKDDILDQMSLIEKRFCENSSLIIILALYGKEDKIIDVTKEIQDRVSNSKLKIKVENSIKTDPCPGVVKELQLDYMINGISYSKKYKEGEMIIIE